MQCFPVDSCAFRRRSCVEGRGCWIEFRSCLGGACVNSILRKHTVAPMRRDKHSEEARSLGCKSGPKRKRGRGKVKRGATKSTNELAMS